MTTAPYYAIVTFGTPSHGCWRNYYRSLESARRDLRGLGGGTMSDAWIVACQTRQDALDADASVSTPVVMWSRTSSTLLADSHHIRVPTMITHHIAAAVDAAKAEAGRTSTYLPLEDVLDHIDAEDGTEPDEDWCLPCGTRILEYGEQIVAVWDHEGECAVILDFDECGGFAR